MSETATLRAYLVDDEPLATKRLTRLLASFSEIQIIGQSSDPAQALQFLMQEKVDLLFLDIQMPGMNGFELLARLDVQPLVIFTTAYDEYALRAFQVNSIDYLLKPIDPEQLERALKKLDRLRPSAQQDWQGRPALTELLKELSASLRGERNEYPQRIASRVGERISFLDLSQVTHFIAQDKLTYAVVNGKQHCVDQPIIELERRLDPQKFLRIHRAALVHLDWVQEIHTGIVSGVVVILKDAQRTQIAVARDRVRELKARLGLI